MEEKETKIQEDERERNRKGETDNRGRIGEKQRKIQVDER